MPPVSSGGIGALYGPYRGRRLDPPNFYLASLPLGGEATLFLEDLRQCYITLTELAIRLVSAN